MGVVMRILSLVSALAMGAVWAAPGLAQSVSQLGGPAETPPASYSADQYVDSRGCVFIRAGYGGQETWVPRVSRTRQPLCGYQPTGGTTVAAPAVPATPQAPAAPARPAVTVATAPQAPVAPARPAQTTVTVRPAATAPAPTTTTTATVAAGVSGCPNLPAAASRRGMSLPGRMGASTPIAGWSSPRRRATRRRTAIGKATCR